MMPKALTDDQVFRFRENLFSNLRMELDQLKNCQSNSVIWGVAGASAVISILETVKPDTPYYPLLFLVPLLIIYPAWMIFFDKSRTIYRLTGFLRLQEKLAITKSRQGLIGWESALERFWARQGDFQTIDRFIREEKKVIENLPENRKKITSHVYLWMVYLVFSLMAILALLICATRMNDFIAYAILGIAGIILALFLEWNYLVQFFMRPRKGNVPTGKSSCKPSWDKSFRGFLNNIFLTLGLFTAVAVIFTIVSYHFFFAQSAFEIMRWIIIAVFILFLAIFLFVLLTTSYIFRNLIYGRYVIGAYESRWKNILDVPGHLPVRMKRRRP